jgi:glycosyltransferase involved in cell wall biosynthesis
MPLNTSPKDQLVTNQVATCAEERLKVAFITDKAAPIYIGGYEVRVYELARRLATSCDVRVFTTLGTPRREIEGIGFRSIIGPNFQRDRSGGRSLAHGLLYAIRLLRNPFETWRPDLVYVEAIPYLHLFTMRSWLAKVGALKLLNVNEAWINYPFGGGSLGRILTRFIRVLLQTGVNWADLCVPISEVTARSLRDNYRATRISVIPMGADIETISEMRSRGIHTKRFDFVTMGRLVPIKRQRDFIRALALMQSKHGWTGIAAIIGDGPERRGLEALCHELGLHRQVRFLGFLDQEAKYQSLLESRVFVLASEREGFSVATLEALACGLPSIVARPKQQEVFGTGDFIVDGITGLTFPVGDVHGLSERMHSLLSDEQLSRSLSSRGRMKANEYDWTSISSRFEHLIETLVKPDP